MGVVDGVVGLGERRRGKRAVVYALLFCFGGACLVFALWWRWINVSPHVSIREPERPVKNAHDYWLAAAARMAPGDIDRLRLLLGETPNAVRRSDAGALPAADRRDILHRNAAALRDFARGQRYPYTDPSARALSNPFSHHAQFRALAHLLRLDALELASGGNTAGAVSRGLDGLHLGVEIPHGSPNIGLLTGAAAQRAARIDLWEQIPRLTAAEARTATRRLERICERQLPFWQTLEYEKWFGLAVTQEMVQHENWRKDLRQFRLGTASGFPRTGEEAWSLFRLATMSKSEFVRNYSEHMDRLISLARAPYPGGAVDFPPAPDTITERLVPVLDIARYVSVREECLNGLLLLTFALHAYHGERGRYPETLAALTPAYLKRIPSDPFAPERGYRYERSGKTYRLYSVGPNLQDDGGNPARSRSARGNGPLSPLYKVERISPGDIVPGINL